MKYSSCGHVNLANVEEPTRLRGWIDSVRDHGGVIFIDLRDETGITQVVVEPENKEFFSMAERCRSEFVLSVDGKIRRRPDGTINRQIPTGEVELLVSSFEILFWFEISFVSPIRDERPRPKPFFEIDELIKLPPVLYFVL